MCEWISSEAGRTGTDGIVVSDIALGTQSARVGAGVITLLVDARLRQVTLGIDYALGPAVGRHAHVVLQAGAHGLAVDLSALTIGAARRWFAWVLLNYWR